MTNRERAEKICDVNPVPMPVGVQLKLVDRVETALEQAERRGRMEILESKELRDFALSFRGTMFLMDEDTRKMVLEIIEDFQKFKNDRMGG